MTKDRVANLRIYTLLTIFSLIISITAIILISKIQSEITKKRNTQTKLIMTTEHQFWNDVSLFKKNQFKFINKLNNQKQQYILAINNLPAEHNKNKHHSKKATPILNSDKVRIIKLTSTLKNMELMTNFLFKNNELFLLTHNNIAKSLNLEDWNAVMVNIENSSSNLKTYINPINLSLAMLQKIETGKQPLTANDKTELLNLANKIGNNPQEDQ